MYSAAIRCGLIEACRPAVGRSDQHRRIPQRFAAASLKPHLLLSRAATCRARIPQRFAAASLKRERFRPRLGICRSIPQRFAAASLKQRLHLRQCALSGRIPQRFAAASLKQPCVVPRPHIGEVYSAAIRCGLIEARSSARPAPARTSCIPQRFAAASLKRRQSRCEPRRATRVFRSDSLRPH